jgi:hypothetical protein
MNEPTRQRPRFTLMQLFVAVTAISVVLGVSVPLLRRWQEHSVQQQCANNQRQLALGIHMYHDTYNQLPPLATDPDHWTWMALLLPFIEDQPTFLRLTFAQPASSRTNRSVAVGYRNPMLLCPTRREQAKRDSGAYAGGQPTDYIAVSTSNALKWDADSDGMIVYRRSVQRGPFVRSATNFGSVTDGMSNTFMIGEKHMRPSWLGGQWDEPALVAIEDPNTIRVATDALGGKPLAQSREDNDEWLFGSWHGGVTFFAFGDASVRPISNKTDPAVLRRASCRNDGQSYALE